MKYPTEFSVLSRAKEGRSKNQQYFYFNIFKFVSKHLSIWLTADIEEFNEGLNFNFSVLPHRYGGGYYFIELNISFQVYKLEIEFHCSLYFGE